MVSELVPEPTAVTRYAPEPIPTDRFDIALIPLDAWDAFGELMNTGLDQLILLFFIILAFAMFVLGTYEIMMGFLAGRSDKGGSQRERSKHFKAGAFALVGLFVLAALPSVMVALGVPFAPYFEGLSVIPSP